MNETIAPAGSETPATTPSSIWARMFNVFATPGDVFDEVRSSPPCASNWLVPAGLLVLIGLLGVLLMFSQDSINQQVSEVADKIVEQQAKRMPMNEQAVELMHKITVYGQKAQFAIAPAIEGFALPFGWALVIWLFGAKLFKGQFSYMKAVEVVGLANMIAVLDWVVRPLLAVGLGNAYAGPHLGMLVKEWDPTNTGHGLLAAVNLMTFWSLAVKSVGLARLSGISWAKAAACLLGVWLLINGTLIGFGAFMQKLSSH